MLLIKDENTLRTFLPNAFASVEGEVSLFDKLQPWLQIGELWLQQKVLGAATMHAISEEESSPLGGTGGGSTVSPARLLSQQLSDLPSLRSTWCCPPTDSASMCWPWTHGVR